MPKGPDSGQWIPLALKISTTVCLNQFSLISNNDRPTEHRLHSSIRPQEPPQRKWSLKTKSHQTGCVINNLSVSVSASTPEVSHIGLRNPQCTVSLWVSCLQCTGPVSLRGPGKEWLFLGRPFSHRIRWDVTSPAALKKEKIDDSESCMHLIWMSLCTEPVPGIGNLDQSPRAPRFCSSYL